MELSNRFDTLNAVLQICLVDLLLSGDNAVLIALASAGLPESVRRQAVLWGTAVAVLFRVLLALAATLALRAPYLKLLGAALLLLIAIELLAGADRPSASRSAVKEDSGLWRAVVLIVSADAVMSLDNVVAIAAAAQDNPLLLLLGLLLSVPVLVFCSLLIARLTASRPWVVMGGAALLGWIAGKTAVTDPAIATALAEQSYGLVALAPVLGAGYVLIQGLRLRRLRAAAGATAAPAQMAELAPPRPGPTGRAAGPRFLERFSLMDLTVFAGAAIPLIGLLATIAYIALRAAGRHT